MLNINQNRPRRAGIAALSAAILLPVVAVQAAQPAQADPSSGTSLGAITSVTRDDAHTVTFSTDSTALLKVTATNADTVRVQVAPDGTFTDPNDPPADSSQPDEPMVKDPAPPSGSLQVAESDQAYTLTLDKAVLVVHKDPATMTMTRPDGTVLWTESAPLSWDANGTTQTLARQPGEQFFGGGEQNGGYNHTGKTIHVANSFNWNEGGYNNSQPYYVSTAGYGVFRDTFQPGTYTFGSTVTTTEQEQRFDAYYFIGNLKQSVGAYTDLVGKPFMPPIYGLENGDSDCYLHNANRGERHTLDAVQVAQGYVDHGMPNGWMLVNDGYGCGYENLAQTGDELNKRHMQLGLWTQNGLANLPQETADGVYVRKLDVAWVGPGYRFALDGCQTAYDGIQQYSDRRGFVYLPNSWAGAQRCGVLWSGDQSGSWDYIRWQIPTYASSTVSGIAYNTGDVDGIYGGSPKTYVRDLQWKTFLPSAMTMDGWAGMDKQPWRYGAEYNAINRKYLLLKERLLPYSYTYSANAHRTGVGQVRPLYLEYPNDPVAASDAAKEEFLSGKDFLVAPVYSDTSVRNGIYLPKGTWVDYWTGRTYQGPTTINGYQAPLDTLPLFVRAGAVVPMWPKGTTSWATRDKHLLDVDIYPQGRSSFDLYEDDGITRQYQDGNSSTQHLSVTAPDAGIGTITVGIGRIDGTYSGQVDQRAYGLSVHTPVQPQQVMAGTHRLDQVADADALAHSATGWYYDAAAGVAHVKTAALARTDSLQVKLLGAAAVTSHHDASNGVVSFTPPAISAPGTTTDVPVTFRNDTGSPVTNVRIGLAGDDGAVAPAQADIPGTVLPGASATVSLPLHVAADAPSGKVLLTATAHYTAGEGAYTTDFSAETVVPYPTVAAAFDNNGVTDKDTYADGNFDGGGDSFAAEQLAAVGVTPGSTITEDGLSYTWPDVAASADDNVASAGQTIALSGQGNALGILGSGSSLSASGTLTVTYTDGSTSTESTGMPNWCCAATDSYGAKVAAASKGRYTPNGLSNTNTDYRVFANTVRLSPGKTVAAVTLPQNSTIHVFGLAVGTVQLPPPPPAGDSWVSDLQWLRASNGWGPVEKDMSNGESAAGDGAPLTLNGTVYAKGLGTNAPSTVSYNLAGKCTSFAATVGVDDEVADRGSVQFTVLADGKPVAQSPVLTGASDSVNLTADVTGADYLDLVVDPTSDGPGSDHGDWANAKVSCTG